MRFTPWRPLGLHQIEMGSLTQSVVSKTMAATKKTTEQTKSVDN